MARSNVYRLRNLGASKKIAVSAALLAGLTPFLSGWIISVAAVNWGVSWMTVVNWGDRLGALSTELRFGLLAAHGSAALSWLSRC
jgi:hypothetical protein